MATVYRRKGAGMPWWIDWRESLPDGRRVRHREPGGRTRGEALRRLAERLKEADRAAAMGIASPGRLTFADFCRFHYLPDHASLKKSGGRDRITIDCHLIPHFGGKQLAQVTLQAAERWKARRATQVKKGTVNREIDTFKRIFSVAEEWGYIVDSPIAGLKRFRTDSRRLVFLEADEIRAFLDAAPSRLRPLFATLIHTGMRKSEALGLTWRQVDFRRRLICLTDTKSGKPRAIPIGSRLASILRKAPRRSVHVFCRQNGKPWKDIRASLARTVERAGIGKRVTLHTLRHTFASHLVMAGVDLVTVKELLGHSSLDMVLRYSHLSEEHKRKAQEELEKRLCG